MFKLTVGRLSSLIAANILLLMVSVFNINASCIITPPDKNYKANGVFSVIRDSVRNSRDDDDALVYIFRPSEKMDNAPMVVFCHQFGNRSPENYMSLINHIVSNGCIVIYPSTVIITAENENANKFRGTPGLIDSAYQKCSRYIDSSRIGIVAHGFGGGAAPSLMYKMINDRKWGLNGAWLYILSPWYMNTMDLRQMANFPEFVNIAVQVFDDDIVNDPQIAADIFSSLSISSGHKRFIIMRSDNNNKCELKASFSLPEGAITPGENTGHLDKYGIYRIVDALSGYSLYNDTNGYNLLFKNKGKSEISMGTWPDNSMVKPMIITDSVWQGLLDRKRFYINPWRSLRNMRLDQTGNRYEREIGQNYRKKTRKSISTFIRTQIIKAREDNNAFVENPITESYGSDGNFTMQADTVMCPYKSKEQFSSEMPVYFFTPSELKAPSPVIIFIHGYIGQNPVEFEPFLRHIVSKGYTVIYPTFSFLPKADTPEKILDKYGYLYAGIMKAARILSWRIDTTKVGFFGQSFGAGTIPAMAYKMFVEKNWGNEGRFMYIAAPWYSFDITKERIEKFPSDVKLVVQIYNDDYINDHAMAADLFYSFPIPESEKDFITLYSDSLDNYTMQANHFVPYGPKNIYGDMNALDYYGVYKTFDALAEYAFTGDEKAKNTALGNGSPEQVFMGLWTENHAVRVANVTDKPKVIYPELQYLYSWNNEQNPRREIIRKRIRK